MSGVGWGESGMERESTCLSQLCCALSCFSHIQLFATLWTIAHQAPLSMGFSRQEHWSELSCPPPGHLPNLWIEPVSLVCCMGRQVLYHWCHLESSHATYHPSNLDWEKCYLETHAPESWAAQVSTGLARPHPFGPMLFTFTKLCFTLVLLDYVTSTS